MHELDAVRVAARCLSQLADAGLSVSGTSDFETVAPAINQMGKDYLTPKLSPGENDFTEQSAFWLLLKNDGDIVGGVGARLDCLENEPVDRYWRRTYARQYPSPKGETIGRVSGALVEQVSGRLVYTGDLFVSPQVSRNIRITRLFVLTLFSVIRTKWQFDWIYAFVRDRDLARGAAYHYGFTYQVPWALEWLDPPSNRGNNECFVGVRRKELEHVFSVLAESPEKL